MRTWKKWNLKKYLIRMCSKVFASSLARKQVCFTVLRRVFGRFLASAAILLLPFFVPLVSAYLAD